MTDLEDAISMQPSYATQIVLPHSSNLGLVLWDRFGRTESMLTLISILRESLSLYPAPHPSRSSSLNSLAAALWSRFVETGSMTDLEEAAAMDHKSLSLRPSPHPLSSQSLIALAISLPSPYEETGSMMILEEVIVNLSFCLIPHPLRAVSLDSLAGALHDRFTKIGWMPDLEEAILMLHELISLCPPPHPDRVLFLKTLLVSWKLGLRKPTRKVTSTKLLLYARRSLRHSHNELS